MELVPTDTAVTGQTITLTVTKPTSSNEPLIHSDLLVNVPDAVDRAQEVTVTVVGRDESLTVPSLAEANVEWRENGSATWLPDGSIALVTPGSSCAPRLVSVHEESTAAADVRLDNSADACFSVRLMHLVVLPPSNLEENATLTVINNDEGGAPITVVIHGDRP